MTHFVREPKPRPLHPHFHSWKNSLNRLLFSQNRASRCPVHPSQSRPTAASPAGAALEPRTPWPSFLSALPRPAPRAGDARQGRGGGTVDPSPGRAGRAARGPSRGSEPARRRDLTCKASPRPPRAELRSEPGATRACAHRGAGPPPHGAQGAPRAAGEMYPARARKFCGAKEAGPLSKLALAVRAECLFPPG